jgi:hypothetical protein
MPGLTPTKYTTHPGLTPTASYNTPRVCNPRHYTTHPGFATGGYKQATPDGVVLTRVTFQGKRSFAFAMICLIRFVKVSQHGLL